MTLIILTSVTYAHKAKNVLKQKGISSNVIRTPRDVGVPGCSYSLELKNKVNEAIDILERDKIEILGVKNV